MSEQAQNDRFERLRHSASHVMAQAVLEAFPEGKLAIGPAIEDGFYYDFDLPRPLTPDDLSQIEARMKEIIKGKHKFVRQEISREEALEVFSDQPYKLELIGDMPEGEVISVYSHDTFTDLCRGPHVEHTGQINLPIDAYLPESYVSDSALRLRLYRRLAGLTVEEEIDDFRAELQDRFGELPPEGGNLFYQLRLKLHAFAAGVKVITTEEGQIVARADSLEDLDREWLQRRLGDRARVARRAVWLPLDGDERWRTTLVATLQAIAEGLEQEAPTIEPTS